MDVVLSASALLVFSPLFLVLAVIIKLTSKGPVFFRQETNRTIRRAVCVPEVPFNAHFQTTRKFTKNSYRTLSRESRTWCRRERIRRASTRSRTIPALPGSENSCAVPAWMNYRSSGMCSRVKCHWSDRGRPVQYEFDVYDIWHRRRSLEVKPGITGLWQVHGRSRTTFDEMVRLDLQYSRSWSPLLDLKILLQTPRAILTGDGAY